GRAQAHPRRGGRGRRRRAAGARRRRPDRGAEQGRAEPGRRLPRPGRPRGAAAAGDAGMSGVSFFLRVMLARAYPRVIGLARQPGWVILETLLPIVSVSA